MALSGHVGSLDEWLCASQAPLASSVSPFATASRSLKATRSMPAARSCQSSSPEPDQKFTPSSALVRDVPASSTSACLDARKCDEEKTVRHGRLRSVFGTRSNAQPIARAAGHGLAAPSTSFETAASLPAMATHGSVSLESLCTALSSPASHVTLATATGYRHWYNESKIQTPTESAAAAAAAFDRSMTSTLRPEYPSGAPPACLLPNIDGWQYGKLTVCTTTEQASVSALLPPIFSPDGCRADGSSASGVIRSAGRSDSLGSWRRGLSEGTVRGGSPRGS